MKRKKIRDFNELKRDFKLFDGKISKKTCILFEIVCIDSKVKGRKYNRI